MDTASNASTVALVVTTLGTVVGLIVKEVIAYLTKRLEFKKEEAKEAKKSELEASIINDQGDIKKMSIETRRDLRVLPGLIDRLAEVEKCLEDRHQGVIAMKDNLIVQNQARCEEEIRALHERLLEQTSGSLGALTDATAVIRDVCETMNKADEIITRAMILLERMEPR